MGGTLWNGTSLLEQDPRIFYSLWTKPTPLYEVSGRAWGGSIHV